MKKKTLFKSLGVSMLGATVMLTTQQALAVEDEGCTFVLCIAAPNPMSIAECAPTVKKVLKRIAKGKSPPVCKASNGEDYRYKTRSVFIKESSQLERATANPPQGYDAVITRVLFSPFSENKVYVKPFNCPAGYRNGEQNVIYHEGKMPTKYRPMIFRADSQVKVTPYSRFKVTGGFRTVGDSENGYEQRVCISGSENGSFKQYSKNGRKIENHTWVDKATIVTGDDANSGMSGSNVFDIYMDGQHRVIAW